MARRKKKQFNKRTKDISKVALNNNLISVDIKDHIDNKGGHPHIIMDDIDDKHISVGLTTKQKKGKNATNYKLEFDPLNRGKHSYMRRQGTVSAQKNYKKLRQGKMSFKDFAQATIYSDKAKQKYIDKKRKKK